MENKLQNVAVTMNRLACQSWFIIAKYSPSARFFSFALCWSQQQRHLRWASKNHEREEGPSTGMAFTCYETVKTPTKDGTVFTISYKMFHLFQLVDMFQSLRWYKVILQRLERHVKTDNKTNVTFTVFTVLVMMWNYLPNFWSQISFCLSYLIAILFITTSLPLLWNACYQPHSWSTARSHLSSTNIKAGCAVLLLFLRF